MNIQKKVEVYLDKKRNTRQIDVVQYSTGVQLVFVLMDFIAPEGTTATLYVQKPSGHIVYQEDNITVSSGTVTVDLENQAIVECGKVIYQLTLVNGEDEITTFASIMNVEKNYADSNAVESTTVISAFKKVTEEQIAKIQAKAEETLATIPDDYTDIYNATVELSQIKAPVIVQKASGNPILLTDSASSKLFDFKAYGKSKQKQYSGKNLWEFGDVSGTTSEIITLDKALPQGTYTLSSLVTSSDTDSSKNRIVLFSEDLQQSLNVDVTRNTRTSETFTTTFEVKTMRFWGGSGSSTSSDDTFSFTDIQIESGTIATDYEPYVGGVASPNPDYPQEIVSVGDSGTLEVKSCGKNLVKNSGTSITKYGYTFTVNEDGSVTVSGESDGTTTYATLMIDNNLNLPNGKYIISAGVSNIGVGVRRSNGSFIGIAYANDDDIEITDDNKTSNLIIYVSNAFSGNATIYPMVRRAEVEDGTYEPYEESIVSIPLTEPLRGIGDVKDEIVKQNGVWGVLRRMAEVVINENSTIALGTHQGYNRFSVTLASKYASVSPFDKGYCSHMTYSKIVLDANTLDNAISVYTANNGTSVRAYFRMDRFATVDELKTWLTDNPITVEYKSATEIFEPFEDQTPFNQLSVFNPIAYIMATDEADMDFEYAVDTKTYIDNKFVELSAALLNN